MKEKKAAFSKIAPKIEGAMNSKAGTGIRQGAGVVGTVVSVIGAIFTLGGAIVGINHASQARIDKKKEIEINLPKD